MGAVREALRAYLSLSGSGDDARLRGALADMVSDARGKAMPPEQLLVLLKDIWSGLAEVRAIGDVGEQVRLQQSVVTMCIKEYYSA